MCTECKTSGSIVTLDRKNCVQCSNNCRFCKEYDVNDPTKHTLTYNYSPQDVIKENLRTECLMCNDEFYLEGGVCKSISDMPSVNRILNCKSYSSPTMCIMCAEGFTLNFNRNACEPGCKAEFPNFCRNCIYKTAIDLVCHDCVDGYFLNKDGECKQCSLDFSCASCYEVTQRCQHLNFYHPFLLDPNGYCKYDSVSNPVVNNVCSKCVGTV